MKFAAQMCLMVATVALCGASAAAWESVTSEEGGFTVELPGAPEEMSQPMEGTHGEVQVNYLLSMMGENAYVVGYADYPPAEFDAQAEMEQTVEHFLSTGNATLDSKGNLEVPGGIGREVTATSENGSVAQMRAMFLGQRLYVLVVNAPVGEFPQEDAAKFFNSFEVAETAAP